MQSTIVSFFVMDERGLLKLRSFWQIYCPFVLINKVFIDKHTVDAYSVKLAQIKRFLGRFKIISIFRNFLKLRN
jgi:hypothetical protein